MVSGRYKSGSLRKVFRKTPGKKTVVHYRTRKPKQAKCKCGALLAAVPRERPHKMKTLPKTKKRPERPYGGVLCPSCMKKKIIMEARNK